MKILTKYLLQFIILFCLYFITAKFGLKLSPVNTFAALIWPPTGIAFAALILFNSRLWPAITLASVIIYHQTGASILLAMSMALGNTLEVVVGVYLFKRVVGNDSKLEKIRDVLVLVLLVGTLSTLISSSIGVSSLYLGNVIPRATLVHTWIAWWAGNLVSILVVASSLMVWSRFPQIKMNRARILEGVILIVCVFILSCLIFTPVAPVEFRKYFRAYWISSFLIWTTLRFGQHANAIFVLIVASVATWGTIHGHGPFKASTESISLFILLLFISAISISGLFFGALGREKEEALRLRDDFISIASHELKTPITSLKLKMDVLKSGLKDVHFGPDTEEILKIVNSSDRNLDRLSNLVDDLLDISQIESGNLKLELKKVNLSNLISDVVENFRPQMIEENCVVELELEDNVVGLWNKYRLEQILTNLLINSIKYGAGKTVKVSLYRKDNWAVFSVKDHGIGISIKNQLRIFERFERVNTSHNIKGIGFGLYICKQIVDQHKGRIEVESKLGEGATFLVSLPIGEVVNKKDHCANFT
jgi:signal transduction histidine kinase